MKRLLVATAVAAIAAVTFAPSSSAEVAAAGSDDAVCIALDPVLGYCQGNPVPGLRGIIERLPA